VHRKIFTSVPCVAWLSVYLLTRFTDVKYFYHCHRVVVESGKNEKNSNFGVLIWRRMFAHRTGRYGKAVVSIVCNAVTENVVWSISESVRNSISLQVNVTSLLSLCRFQIPASPLVSSLSLLLGFLVCDSASFVHQPV